MFLQEPEWAAVWEKSRLERQASIFLPAGLSLCSVLTGISSSPGVTSHAVSLLSLHLDGRES